MLVLDHVKFFDLLFLDVDFVKVFLLVQLQYFNSVLYCFDVPLGL